MNHEGMRQAAVLLASLHPSDRAWIRRRLPAGWRGRLKRLLRQVRALGQADGGVLSDALHTAQDARPDPPTPDVLLAGLDGLSPAWVARTLTACALDHRELYLAGQLPVDQENVERALREGPASLPPKLAGALAQLVRQRGERALALGSCL
ncbi:hypothetical protein [Rhodanobacter sp. KK11]|jgi:hypothetical protein|uniref:hypothetical protein n=1 Tax=Rhodanobacter sp. KK11 TaxID=3083255 RepID=UPI002967709D|nr:hypothetical protein [Rhodanobacter sp. KK11]MDW2981771.1 hypothetical protein [Rhodanobacter sp. KK11]